jgi:hypothetical protein
MYSIKLVQEGRIFLDPTDVRVAQESAPRIVFLKKPTFPG